MKGLTLIEILVAITIIAILSVLSIFAIGEVNKSSRDTSRVNALGQILTSLQDYKKDNLNYPQTGLVSFSDGLYINGVQFVILTGSNVAGPSTSPVQTRYGYVNTGGKIGLCAVLESGSVQNVGEINIDCL